MDVSLAMIQMNAAMIAAGLFAFIGLRLLRDARARERRLAAALDLVKRPSDRGGAAFRASRCRN